MPVGVGLAVATERGAWTLLTVVGPLVVWRARRGSDLFARGHARAALCANLSAGLYLLAIGTALTLGGLVFLRAGTALPVVAAVGSLAGLVALGGSGLVLVVGWWVMAGIGVVRAIRGLDWRYPLVLPMFRRVG